MKYIVGWQLRCLIYSVEKRHWFVNKNKNILYINFIKELIKKPACILGYESGDEGEKETKKYDKKHKKRWKENSQMHHSIRNICACLLLLFIFCLFMFFFLA